MRTGTEAEAEWETEPGALARIDPEVAALLAAERERQNHGIHLLAPSMLVTPAIRECLASDLLNLDGEGYLRNGLADISDYADFERRYRADGGSKYNPSGPVAEYVEFLAARRLAQMLCAGAGLEPEELNVNVQPVSGSFANLAVLRGALSPGDTALSLGLSSGGHLSHGAPFHQSGQDYDIVSIDHGVDDQSLDLEALYKTAATHKPRVVIIGASSFPRRISWKKVADTVRELSPRPVVVADIAHFAGLVATGTYDNPLPWADVVTMVGYKTLGGPKSAAIAVRDPALARRIDRALFPGLQGAPRMAEICALATAARVAQGEEFRGLIHRSVANAALLKDALDDHGIHAAFGGTDTHMLVLKDQAHAAQLAQYLERIGLLTNSNLLPGDRGPSAASGIRLGTVGATQRGLEAVAIPELAALLADAFTEFRNSSGTGSAQLAQRCRKFARTHLVDIELVNRKERTP
ncbi:serine hydroxymethyltransferase [Streptomyces sp. NPDC057654]|uniref:serine hydroxymethyltransferase n=1 Tax=Streptomyces sp. NPDC057654 TaxID=3346196 RepID=UPI003684DE4B